MEYFWNRQVKDKTYRMNKMLFIIMSVLILSTFTWALVTTGGNDKLSPYLTCPPETRCVNPLYKSSICGKTLPANSDFCTIPYLAAGTSLGNPPPFIFQYFWTLILIEVLGVLSLNHLLYNKGFFKGLGGTIK